MVYKVERKFKSGKRWVQVHQTNNKQEANEFKESSKRTFGHQASYRVKIKTPRITPKMPKLR